MSDASPGFRQFREWVLQKAEDTEFDVETEDFGNLVIQEADGFYYFYDEAQRRLIKNFVLRVGPRVDTMCSVVLVPKEGGLTPRLRMWKKDKSQAGKAGAIAYEAIQANEESVLAKSSVDLDDAHENLWKLINFLESVQEIELPAHQFRVTPAANMELVRAFEGQDKGTVLAAVKAYLGNDLTEADVQMLVGRRRALERFEKMLEQPGFFAAEMHRRGKTRVEAVWQEFFEENQWIFGYGLNLVACEAYSDKGLELITTGANVFTGGGKRIDAVMRTRGFIQSLVFTEIKKPDTRLLRDEQYRAPDVYQPHGELSGAVSQVQKTTHKAIRKLEDLHRQHNAEGGFEFEVSTIKPRQVVVAGHLSQLADGDSPNVEKLTSFELYRRSQQDLEILTFDELLARARFIVETTEMAAG